MARRNQLMRGSPSIVTAALKADIPELQRYRSGLLRELLRFIENVFRYEPAGSDGRTVVPASMKGDPVGVAIGCRVYPVSLAFLPMLAKALRQGATYVIDSGVQAVPHSRDQLKWHAKGGQVLRFVSGFACRPPTNLTVGASAWPEGCLTIDSRL
jgi:hypothetical protein